MNRRHLRPVRGDQRGQSVVEFVVVIVAFGALLLGIFQGALLYRAKSSVDYAAFMAARSGSLHGATEASLRAGLAKGLAPLYATQPGIEGTLRARNKAQRAVAAGNARIQIISPTRAAFNQVAVTQFDGVKAIPNDDLAYRSPAVRAANVLKVKVIYDYPLIVPVIDKLIGHWFGGKRMVVDRGGHRRRTYALPIEATAIVRMQSPIRDAGALGTLGGGEGPPGGGTNPPGGGSTNPPAGGGQNPPSGPPGGGTNPPGGPPGGGTSPPPGGGGDGGDGPPLVCPLPPNWRDR